MTGVSSQAGLASLRGIRVAHNPGRTRNDVLPDTAALAAFVPDDVLTGVSIAGAVRLIAEARQHDRVDGVYGLRARQQQASDQAAYAARMGHSLAQIRGWAIEEALLRDARQTAAEIAAQRAGVAA